jgi:hypothetical protein
MLTCRDGLFAGTFFQSRSKGFRLIAHAVENQENWPKTFKESTLNPDFYVLRERFEDEIFPWDFIEHGVRQIIFVKRISSSIA